MVCDAIVVPGKKGEVLVMEKLGVGVWVVVAVEMVAQLSRPRVAAIGHRGRTWE